VAQEKGNRYPVPPEDSPLLLAVQAQTYLGIGRTSFEKYVRPWLTDIKIGRRLLFSKEELEQVIEKMGGKSKIRDQRWGKGGGGE